MKSLASVFAVVFFCSALFAQDSESYQPKTIDEVVAVVGDEIVLKSDVETQVAAAEEAGEEVGEEGACILFEQLMMQALMLHQAFLDSVVVSDAEVDANMNQRIAMFVQQFGSEERLETYYGKSIEQIKKEFSGIIRDQLIAERIRSNIVEKVKVTPADVREFFNEFPEEAIPYINSEIEVAQIVCKPPISSEEKKRVRERLDGLRQRILDGEDFGTLAVLYSEDPGSASQRGRLGFMSRGQLVPEFARVAFNLQPGQTSEIVETDFGFHIIQLNERRGERADFSHILLIPKIAPDDVVKARQLLDSVRTAIVSKDDTLTWDRAVELFSDDSDSRFNNGVMRNPYSGTSKFAADELGQYDSKLFFTIDKLEIGQISDPVVTQMKDGSQAFRIIRLNQRTEPHPANLEDDYQLIQESALQEKQNEAISRWVNKYAARTYVKIDEEYKSCKFDHNWEKAQ